MNATTVAVDPASSVFQLGVTKEYWRALKAHRPTRAALNRWLFDREVAPLRRAARPPPADGSMTGSCRRPSAVNPLDEPKHSDYRPLDV